MARFGEYSESETRMMNAISSRLDGKGSGHNWVFRVRSHRYNLTQIGDGMHDSDVYLVVVFKIGGEKDYLGFEYVMPRMRAEMSSATWSLPTHNTSS